MKHDVIIIGGGLSALTCGIALATAGKDVAIMARGQSSLHYNSGSLGLLGYTPAGEPVERPLDAMPSLPATHPYSKLTAADVAHNVAMAQVLLAGSGLDFTSDAHRNHMRLTPLGGWKPAWLTLSDYVTAPLPARDVAVVEIEGFLDYGAQFAARGLEKAGVRCRVLRIAVPALDKLINNTAVLRSTAVARLLQNDGVLSDFARRVKGALGTADLVVLPAVLPLNDDGTLEKLRRLLPVPVKLAATLPPSIAGTRLMTRLRKVFVDHGGTFLLGSMVTGGTIACNHVAGIRAKNFPDQELMAGHYVLATGSFMGGGLVAQRDRIVEPLFNLDVDYEPGTAQWTGESLYDRHRFMEFGVRTTGDFHAVIHGQPVDNLYAIGSVLSGHNSVKLADGEGVDLLTAIQVAREINNSF